MNDSNYLIHYGILGMKWGVRRFQNPDGSLTEAGKRRYLNNDPFRTLNNSKRNFLRSSVYNKTVDYYTKKGKEEYDRLATEPKVKKLIDSRREEYKRVTNELNDVVKRIADMGDAFEDYENSSSDYSKLSELSNERKRIAKDTARELISMLGDLPANSNGFSDYGWGNGVEYLLEKNINENESVPYYWPWY